MYGIQVAGIEATVATSFDSSESLDRNSAKALARDFLQEFRHLNLGSDDIDLLSRDDLYRFHLKVRFFSGLGSVDVYSNRVEMVFRDMKTTADVDLVSSVLTGIGERLEKAASHSTSTITITFHAHLKSGGNRDEYFASLIPQIRSAQPQGLTFYRSDAGFLPEVRIAIERSNNLPDGIFVAWNGIVEGVIKPDSISSLKQSLYNFLPIVNLMPAEGTTPL